MMSEESSDNEFMYHTTGKKKAIHKNGIATSKNKNKTYNDWIIG